MWQCQGEMKYVEHCLFCPLPPLLISAINYNFVAKSFKIIMIMITIEIVMKQNFKYNKTFITKYESACHREQAIS